MTLRAEANRHRAIAERLDLLAEDYLDVGEVLQEFHGMSQRKAILKAVERYGPQTTQELFERLNAGGQAFKHRDYVTALLGRLKDKLERTEDGKQIRLKNEKPL